MSGSALRFLIVATWICLSMTICRASLRAEVSEVAERPGRVEEVDLSALLPGMESTFVLLREDGTARIHDPERAAERFLPASTFKIPNTLIALETGVADGPGFPLAWDRERDPPAGWWPASWRRDQTLESAFRDSVFWYFRELARRIGEERMERWLERFGYGNRDLGGGVDGFWLLGDLRISPREQVRFLSRFWEGELGVSERSREILREIALLEETPAYRLSGKTGTYEVTPTREGGWLVGWLEVGERVSFYALHVEGERVWEDWPPQERKELVRRVLVELGEIPGPSR